MKVDFAERNFTRDINPHHNHAGNPSKEDIGTSLHDIKRIIGVFGAFEPVGTDNWPVRTGEPSIESIFVAIIVDATYLDFGEVGACIEDPFGSFVGFGLMEHRDGDAPRNLAGNVPVFETLEIVDKDFFLVCGVELDFAGLEVLNGHFSKAFDVDEPLAFERWLDDGIALVAVGDRVGDFFFAAEQPLVFEVLKDFCAAFGRSEACVIGASGGEHFAIFADDLDAVKVMAFADFEIVEIVGRGNFDGASAVSRVGVFVSDDGDYTIGIRNSGHNA